MLIIKYSCFPKVGYPFCKSRSANGIITRQANGEARAGNPTTTGIAYWWKPIDVR